jgi:NADPH-dependent 2,4-dienoyl-CoA reductase/sulfur reductase-like enzyme
VIIGDEPHAPDDRPPLSKDFLTGRADESQLVLTDADEITDLDAEWFLGTRARELDARGRIVLLDEGRTVTTDGVVIATGASARRLPGADLAGSTPCALSTTPAAYARTSPEDPARLSSSAASSAPRPRRPAPPSATPSPSSRPPPFRSRANSAPGWPPCAPPCTRAVGVELVTGTGWSACAAQSPHRSGTLRRTHPPRRRCDRRHRHHAQHRLVAGSTLALHDGVLCDDGCATALPQVVAVGDVARVGGSRAEHWTSATEQPRVAVANLLAGGTVLSVDRPRPVMRARRELTRECG